MSLHYVMCYRHQKTGEYALTWWGPNSSGYTFNVDNAGKYTKENLPIDEEHYHEDYPIPVELVDSLAVKMVIDKAKLGRIVVNDYSNRRKLKVLKKYMIKQGKSGWDRRAFIEPERFLAMNKYTSSIISEISKEPAT